MRQGFLSFAGRSLRNQAPISYTATSTPRGLGRSLFGLSTGADAQLRAMGSVGALFAIVHRTSNSTAAVNWRLYRKAKSGLKEDRKEVTSHAALDLWNKPNAFFTRMEFVETVQQHIDLTGEGWWVIARNPRAKVPLELWPVRPDRMMPVPDPDNFLSGYMYLSPGGEQIALTLDQVIQLRMPNPEDPYRGMGPVQSVMPDLDASRYSAVWNRNFFLNSAEPGGIIQIPDRLSDDEFDELSSRWNEQHKGVANAHRVAIIEKGQWVDRKITQRDMQFAELRTVTSDMIREAFGIPKFAVGVITDINRATAEAAKAWFAEQLTVPRLERIKQALNSELLPLFGATADGLEFDYDDPVPPDLESQNAKLTTQASAAAMLRDAGWAPDDILTTVGLPEMRYTGPPVAADKIAPHPDAPAAEPADAWRAVTGGLRDDPQNAMRWVAVAVDDADTCQPCRDNDGHLYRNREDAYADYPGGEGYVDCIGAKYGNACRCKVVKRRKGNDGKEDD